ncbi:MAG: ribose 5-phosphate isomerase B [Desulfuromonas sp.]|nr:MAG: ribose 5-phosphate isomerase B [Desulfuromonas sp.]
MIVVASDHGGLSLKSAICAVLKEREIVYRDLGTDNGDSVDYPDFAAKVAAQVSSGEAEQGVLICGTGIGISIAANKYPGVRAALVHDPFTAKMSKEHNNANILVMGGRVLSEVEARNLVTIWLDTAFEGGRHQKRLDKITAIEENLRSSR